MLDLNLNSAINFLRKLEKSQLGFFTNHPIYIDKYKFFELYSREVLPEPIKLDTLVLELHKRCNLDCIFCIKNGNIHGEYVYCGCRKDSSSQILPEKMIINLIEEAKNFGLKYVYLIGGEPFLFRKDLVELLYFFKKESFHYNNSYKCDTS